MKQAEPKSTNFLFPTEVQNNPPSTNQVKTIVRSDEARQSSQVDGVSQTLPPLKEREKMDTFKLAKAKLKIKKLNIQIKELKKKIKIKNSQIEGCRGLLKTQGEWLGQANEEIMQLKNKCKECDIMVQEIINNNNHQSKQRMGKDEN